ncbi:MAG TPA: zinc ribbon domain-containing protein [Candidatus Limnocylindrales bacterium]|nr:zinc ribbon domain-containing protein [Candidatus Limnocylindrales bacterium]
MALCFQCDKDLVPEAKFCHRCGTPTFSSARRGEPAEADAEDRARIKQEVVGAAKTPTTTRMASTLMAPQGPRPRPAPIPAAPPVWKSVVKARIWRSPALWITFILVLMVVGLWVFIDDLTSKGRQGGEFYRVVTRLATICSKDGRPQIEAYISRINQVGGGESMLDSALLFDTVTRNVRVPRGDCSKIVDALSRPDRFQRLVD